MCCGALATAAYCLQRCLLASRCLIDAGGCYQLCLRQVSIGSQQPCHNHSSGDGSAIQCNSSDVEGFSAGYKSMCQFLALPLLQLPQVAKYDVIMRLDSDSFIIGALLLLLLLLLLLPSPLFARVLRGNLLHF